MPHKTPSVLGACFLPALALLLLAGLAGVGYVLSLPAQAAQRFGPPAATIGGAQRYWLAATLLWQAGALSEPADPQGAAQPFRVGEGESVASISERLGRAGLIRDAAVFRAYLLYSGLDTRIQAGEYTLSPAASALEIAANLQSAVSPSATFYLLAGWRVEEVAAALPTSGLSLGTEEFLAAAQHGPLSFGFTFDNGAMNSVEGFLYPGVYEFSREIDATGMIAALLGNFAASVSPQIVEGLAQQGLSLPEGVILASIIEREAVLDDEMPLIASVFYNRLAIGMKLDSDPTVQYALGYRSEQGTWWTNPLTANDLQVDSPYNTYLYTGLPPGPICSPSAAALQAVAYPAQTPYYYFRAACDKSGRHQFAITYEEHLRNGCP